MSMYIPSADAVARRLEAGGCPTDYLGYDRRAQEYEVMVKHEDLPKLQFDASIKDFVSMNFEGGRVVVRFTMK